MNNEISELIKEYAKVYQRFESFQKTEKKDKTPESKLPQGDQKTGVIGEYYAKLFYKNKKDVQKVDYASIGSKHDLIVEFSNGTNKRIQVKCVSAHSKSKILAPINMTMTDDGVPFHELLIIYLDINFEPQAAYLNTYEAIKIKYESKSKSRSLGKSVFRISGAKIKCAESSVSGYIDWTQDVTSGFEFLKSQQSIFQEPKKSQKSIYKLKKLQYEEGAILALQNSENLFQTAQYCLDKGLSGNGLSILITSMEELAKAAYLKLKAHDPELVIQELDDLFKSHQTKHIVSVRLFFQVINRRYKSLPKEKRESFGLVIIVFTGVLIYYRAISESPKISFEEARQKGYYVSYDQKDDKWQAPQTYYEIDSLMSYLQLAKSILDSVKEDLFSKKLTFHEVDEYIKILGDENVWFRKRYAQVMKSIQNENMFP